MKKISRVLSMVIVVGMMAAIPASTQVLSGSGGESSEAGYLPMLVLVNRLELSVEQMEALRDILTNVLEEKDEMDRFRAEFDEVMIEFNGTSDELDELLTTFREDQRALAEAMRESIGTSLDEVRDLLSINQGIVLRAALRELVGGGALGLGAPSGGPMRSSMHGGARMAGTSGSFDRDSMLSMMQERMGSGAMTERFGERMSQGLDDADIEAMIRQRIGQDFDDETMEAMREQMQGRFERMREHFLGAVEDLGERLGQNLGGRNFGQMGQMNGRAGNAPVYKIEGGQLVGRTQLGDRGQRFELLEQVAEVLELKLEAME
ncbi:hypothetical protein ACFLS0_03825 [Candidatus Bipolaricaulota bacterium]